MSVTTLPHISRLIVWFLMDQTEVADELGVGTNVYTDTPASPTFPRIRVSQVGGSMVEDSIYWLERTVVQVDVWGPGKNDRASAHAIAEMARAVIHERLRGTVSHGDIEAVVSSVQVGSVSDTLDTTFKPPKPQSRFDLVVTAHPVPTTGS